VPRRGTCAPERYLCPGGVPVPRRGTCAPEGYLCPGEVPVPRRGTCAPEGYLCTGEVPVHRRGTCAPEGYLCPGGVLRGPPSSLIRLNKKMPPREYPEGTMFESRFWHLYPEGVLRGPPSMLIRLNKKYAPTGIPKGHDVRIPVLAPVPRRGTCAPERYLCPEGVVRGPPSLQICLNKKMPPREYPKGTMFESRFWHLYPEGVLRGPPSMLIRLNKKMPPREFESRFWP